MTRVPAVAALDVGTSAVKALVVAADGRILGSGSVELRTSRPAPRHAEQEPEDWWRAAAGALAACGPVRDGAQALAVTGQMQDLIFAGGKGVSRPAILYSDARAGAEHDEIAAELGPEWSVRAGNEPDATSLPGKLRFLARTEPGSLTSADSLLLGAGGYLCWRATGVAACDVTTASTTGLLDAGRRDWWPAAVDAAGAGGLLPKLVTGDSVTGDLGASAAAVLGLPAGIPVLLASGDAASTTSGVVGDELGTAYAYLGTSGWLAAVVDTARRPPAAHRLLLPQPGQDLLIGAVLAAGGAADWARRTLLPGTTPAAADRMAAGSGPSGLLALPSLDGERYPLRNPDARGVFVGLTPSSTAPQMYRAVLEGVALALASLLDAVPDRTGPLPVCGGGARSQLWLQILADVTGRPVVPLAPEDAGAAAAFGAARTAWRAVTGRAPVPLAARGIGRTVQPGPDAARYAALRPAYAALYQALPDVFGALRSAARPTPPA
ncbi:FGGY family carbohydrate kinase [Actinoplanes sp. NPDC023801]|uniref:FGGY family carbohydrate kinase n=1 Tax=Actinoplanes sp. NPDC023801 TaxID=3154595 RepID=UPI0033FF2709